MVPVLNKIPILVTLLVVSSGANVPLWDEHEENHGQEVEDTSFVKPVLSSILNIESPYSEEEYFFLENYGNNRPVLMYDDHQRNQKRSRNHRKGARNVCETIRTRVYAPDDGYIYRPGSYDEEFCRNIVHTFNENAGSRNKMICYPSERGCENVTQVMTFFRRTPASTCWESYPKTVYIGCKCNIDEERLKSLHYRP